MEEEIPDYLRKPGTIPENQKRVRLGGGPYLKRGTRAWIIEKANDSGCSLGEVIDQLVEFCVQSKTFSVRKKK